MTLALGVEGDNRVKGALKAIADTGELNEEQFQDIEKAVENVRRQMHPGGLMLASIISMKADSYGTGEELEPNTFIQKDGSESGIPHHYFDEAGIRALFDKWELVVLAESIMDYKERNLDNYLKNPFRYTNWNLVARKK